MRVARIAFLAGVAAIGLAGVAEARPPEPHVLTLRLPDGQVEQVRYVGDVPPTVIVAPATAIGAAVPADPFAMLERMSAEMDRQAEAMFRTIDALAMPQGLVPTLAAGVGNPPVPNGPGMCVHSVQITFAGDGRAPHVLSQTSGDCGPGGGAAAPATLLPDVPAAKPAPQVIQAKAGYPYAGLVHMVSDRQR